MVILMRNIKLTHKICMEKQLNIFVIIQ